MRNYRELLSRMPIMQHSLADFVRWEARWSAGDPAIDAQDRAIVALVGEIRALGRRRLDVEALREITDRASVILAAHFLSEERLLVEIGYPELERHIAEHAQIAADLADIRARLETADRRGTRRVYVQLENFLLGVTLGHMANSDGDYCRYLDDAMASAPTGCA